MAKYGHLSQRDPSADYTPYLMQGLNQGMRIGLNEHDRTQKRKDVADARQFKTQWRDDERAHQSGLANQERQRAIEANQQRLGAMEKFFMDPKAGNRLGESITRPADAMAGPQAGQLAGAQAAGSAGGAPMHGPEELALGPLAMASQTTPFTDDSALMQAIQEAKAMQYIDTDFLQDLVKMKESQTKLQMDRQAQQIMMMNAQTSRMNAQTSQGNLGARRQEFSAGRDDASRKAKKEAYDEKQRLQKQELDFNLMMEDRATAAKDDAYGRIDSRMKGFSALLGLEGQAVPGSNTFNFNDGTFNPAQQPKQGPGGELGLSEKLRMGLQSPITRPGAVMSMAGPEMKMKVSMDQIPPEWEETYAKARGGRVWDAYEDYPKHRKQEFMNGLVNEGLLNQDMTPKAGMETQVQGRLRDMIMEDYSSIEEAFSFGSPTDRITSRLAGETAETGQKNTLSDAALDTAKKDRGFSSQLEAQTEVDRMLRTMRYGTNIDQLHQRLEGVPSGGKMQNELTRRHAELQRETQRGAMKGASSRGAGRDKVTSYPMIGIM